MLYLKSEPEKFNSKIKIYRHSEMSNFHFIIIELKISISKTFTFPDAAIVNKS